MASSSGGSIVATIDIVNEKIITQNDRNFILSFDISNEIGVQTDIKYAIQLTQVLPSSEPVVDEHVYSDSFSLNQGQTVSKTIDYSVPDSLPAGTYKLWIESENNSRPHA